MSSVKKSSATPSTKSARAKKKREEEERKKREEEEAQQRAEVAEKERAETEKRLAEEKKSVAKEINELRRRELAEFYEFIEPKREQTKRIHEKQREEFQWKRVMRCDGTPDPTVLPEINTFISLWRDDKEHLDAKFTMQQTNLVLTLIREIQFVINSIPLGSSELARIPIYRKTVHELEDTLHHKWLQSIHYTMIQATDLQDLETNNFQYSTENENVTLCIWGNLSHNPRIQEFKFEKYSFGFKVPKPLTLANIAIVGFFLKYDYFSDRSALSKCRVRVPEYSYDPIPEALPEEPTKDANEGEDANKDQFDPSLPPELRKLMEQTKQREEEAAAAEAAAQREPSTVERSNTQVTSEGGQKEPGEEKTLVKDELGTQISADQILEELADESIIDLRSHWPLLPLLQIGLYNIPPQPKKVQDWTIMQLDDQDILVSYPYPSDPTIATRFYEEYSSLVRSKTGEIEVGKGKGDEKTIDPLDPSITLDGTMIENNPEIRRMYLAIAVKQESALVLTYKIPNDVYVKEKPLLARWIKERNHWRQEGYVNYQYAPETRTISFETYDFGIYALLNDRHAHMPFQSWRMRPKTTNHVYFTLNTQSFEITFEVRNDQVAVFLPARKPEIPGDDKTKATAGSSPFANPLLSKPAGATVQSTSALSTTRTGVDDGGDIYKTHPAFVAIIEPMANRFMTIKELIEKLRSVGLNVFPEADSESYVSVINKNHKLEWWVYNQMAIVASSAAFSYSHWNAFVNDELKIVLGCKEQLLDRSTADDDPRCLIFNNELVGFSDVCESSPEFVEASTFSDYHAELYHLVRDKFSAEAVARVMDTTPLFIETVHQLLMSIKPLTYA